MLIAARNAMMVGGKRWKNPYVTDGLIAMWDGEWNAGGGIHDPNATAWKDLCGFVSDLQIDQYSSFSDKSLNVSAQSGRMAGNVSDAQMLRDILYCQNNYQGWTFEFIFGLDTSVMPNRSTGHPLSTENENIFSLQSFFAIDSHPNYATTQMSVSIAGIGRKISSYRTIYNNTVAKAVFCHDGSSLSIIINESTDTSTWEMVSPSYGTSFYSTLGISVRENTFAGPIYGERFYSRALTASEIAHNYAVDKARFNLP